MPNAGEITNTEREKKALALAVAAIYFDDSADFAGALWEIVAALNPEALDLLRADEGKAYDKYVVPDA